MITADHPTRSSRSATPVNRIAGIDTSISDQTHRIRSEWTEIDFTVRRVDEPVLSLIRVLEKMPTNR